MGFPSARARFYPWNARTLFVVWPFEGVARVRISGTIRALVKCRILFYPWLNRSYLDSEAFAGDPHF